MLIVFSYKKNAFLTLKVRNRINFKRKIREIETIMFFLLTKGFFFVLFKVEWDIKPVSVNSLFVIGQKTLIKC